MKFSLCVLIFFACCAIGWCGNQEYTVDNERIVVLEGEEETLFLFDGLKLVRRERAINGTIGIAEDLDGDNFVMSVELLTSSSGQNYQRFGPDVPKTNICECFKKFYVKFVQPALKLDENTNMPVVPDDGICPFPKGVYYVSTILLNIETWPNRMPLGSLKVIVRVHKNDKFVGGAEFYFNIQQK